MEIFERSFQNIEKTFVEEDGKLKKSEDSHQELA
jgi:hypothetical protein